MDVLKYVKTFYGFCMDVTLKTRMFSRLVRGQASQAPAGQTPGAWSEGSSCSQEEEMCRGGGEKVGEGAAGSGPECRSRKACPQKGAGPHRVAILISP